MSLMYLTKTGMSIPVHIKKHDNFEIARMKILIEFMKVCLKKEKMYKGRYDRGSLLMFS